jgi:Ca2+-binding RTX toxin-like protein
MATINGTNGNDTLIGTSGDDTINGLDGIDLVRYTNATGGITANLTTGIVSGAGVGTDTLTGIEQIRGSNFADVYIATGFNQGASPAPGTSPLFNEFEGMGGNDTITGNGFTRVSYLNATAGVTVDIAAGTGKGTAAGDLAGVGIDSFTGVNAVRGSNFDDVLLGSDNRVFTSENFEGRGGNDLIDGRGGFDRVVYGNNSAIAAGITVNLAAGIVTGDAAVGADTLRSVEAVRGTDFADTFDATGFTASSTNAGSNGVNEQGAAFNEFDGMGGNDTIIGNGNTRVSYAFALAGVTVDIQAGTGHGTAPGDLAGVGTDTFTGVNSLEGSNFNDLLFGSDNAPSTTENFVGSVGNDTIDGRGGFDRAIYSNDAAVAAGISVNLAAGIVTGDARIGTDTLRSVEAVRGTAFADTFDATGFTASSTNAGSADVNEHGAAFNEFEGLGGNDTITGNGYTRISYLNALAGVTVTMTSAGAGSAHGTDTGDIAEVGTDTFTGVSAVRGSEFADVIDGSANPAATAESFEGRGGNDVLVGGAGNDSLDGGDGGDRLVGGAGADVLSGGDGYDIASYENATTGVSIDLTADASTWSGDAHGDTLTSIEAFALTNFADVFRGDDTANSVTSGAGNDQLFGRGGNDTLAAGDGNDVLDGGAGADMLNGGAGTDTASYADATTGVSIDLTKASSTWTGDAHSDTLTSIEAFDLTNFADVFRGDDTANSVTSAAGDDQLFGRGGNDTLAAGDGNDVLDGGAGADMLNGGAGTDTASYADATSGVSIDLTADASTWTGDAHGDTFISIEAYDLTNFNDVFRGDDTANSVTSGAGDDQLFGRGGNDTLAAGNGNDVLDGGAGADMLNGGDGTDTASYADATTGVSIDLTLASSTWTGDAHGDTFTSIEAFDLTTFNDVFRGDDTSNSVTSGAGDDQLFGRGGNDTLAAGNGNDILSGGLGADALTGGQGADIFQYTAVEESSGAVVNGVLQIDNITDFTQGQDKIDLSAIDANGTLAGDQAFTFLEPPPPPPDIEVDHPAGGGDDPVPTITDWTGLVWSEIDGSGHTTIFVSTDADSDAEMQIHMPQAIQLHASDFIL